MICLVQIHPICWCSRMIKTIYQYRFWGEKALCQVFVVEGYRAYQADLKGEKSSVEKETQNIYNKRPEILCGLWPRFQSDCTMYYYFPLKPYCLFSLFLFSLWQATKYFLNFIVKSLCISFPTEGFPHLR